MDSWEGDITLLKVAEQLKDSHHQMSVGMKTLDGVGRSCFIKYFLHNNKKYAYMFLFYYYIFICFQSSM